MDEHPLEELIDRSVNRALTRSDGNISKVARLLGITRLQLEHRQKKIHHWLVTTRTSAHKAGGGAGRFVTCRLTSPITVPALKTSFSFHE
uniref:helix-turn-helix domain-containing protein n=1 Tax=Pseudomonas fluorescens TaxID=294 RepID=UPI00155DD666